MAGAYVANRGQGTVDGTFALTWTFNTSGAVASGNKIIIPIVLHSSANTIDSVSGGSLTWTQDAFASNADGEVAYIFSADAPSGLASGTTITVVEHAGGDVFEKRRYSVIEASGLATGAPGSTQKAAGTGTSTTPSSGATSGSAASGDFAVGVTAWKATSVAGDWTVTSGYSKDATLSANSRSMWAEYQALGSSGAITSHPTTTLTAIQWATAAVYYAQAGPGSFSGSAALTGVGALAASAGNVSAQLTGVGAMSATGGSISITVVGNAISVACVGAVTVAQLRTALNAFGASAALVTTSLIGSGASPVIALATTPLSGGSGGAGFVPGVGTFYESVNGTGSEIDSKADGTLLNPAHSYYVKIIARDTDGSATASA